MASGDARQRVLTVYSDRLGGAPRPFIHPHLPREHRIGVVWEVSWVSCLPNRMNGRDQPNTYRDGWLCVKREERQEMEARGEILASSFPLSSLYHRPATRGPSCSDAHPSSPTPSVSLIDIPGRPLGHLIPSSSLSSPLHRPPNPPPPSPNTLTHSNPPEEPKNLHRQS